MNTFLARYTILDADGRKYRLFSPPFIFFQGQASLPAAMPAGAFSLRSPLDKRLDEGGDFHFHQAIRRLAAATVPSCHGFARTIYPASQRSFKMHKMSFDWPQHILVTRSFQERII